MKIKWLEHIFVNYINGKTFTHVIDSFHFDNHYVLIRVLCRLLRTQITKHTSKIYLHTHCERHFTEEVKF